MSTSLSAPGPRGRVLGGLGLPLAALGVVYGDIGTSPLYAFREALHAAGGRPDLVERSAVLGVLSLILWALILVVTVKYVLILLRADNQGEGGTLSLLALAQQAMPARAAWVTLVGLIGAALFFGDAAITPAISVLSAVEGLSLLHPGIGSHAVLIALAILLPLFLCQSRGTAAVARFFGPVMALWFLVMALGGAAQLAARPEVLAALNPLYALQFLAAHGMVGLTVLGAVFLAVTGAEALYADMGHFGRGPIRRAWMFWAFPALLLNYFGQAALILGDSAALESPFFRLFPAPLLLPVVVLAALATVIASQAVITGAFSLTRQAVQLRLLPRLRIRHTSDEQEGQIYIPAVNTLLLVAVTGLVLSFGSSSSLASAYGISVTGTMVVTTLLAMLVARHCWNWPWIGVALLLLPFLLLDLVFFGANLIKLLDGGWVPLLGAMVIVAVMLSWQRGLRLLDRLDRRAELPLAAFLPQLDSPSIAVVPGTGIYLTLNPDLTPGALLHCLKHFRALHEQLVLVTVTTANVPVVPAPERVQNEVVTPRLTKMIVTFGYAEVPDLPRTLMQHCNEGRGFNTMSTSFILSRRRLRLATNSRMPGWQARLFLWCARNAAGPTDYFRIPATRVVEIGTQVNV